MKKFNYIMIIFFLALYGCERKSIMLNFENIDRLNNLIDYKYSIYKYFNEVDEKSLISVEYYSQEELLIEHIGNETHYKFIYNSNKKLLERYSCRFNNCDNGLRELMVYDKKGNHIGSHITQDSLIDLDTIKIKQTKFYNSKNQLIRELSDTGTYTNGERWEYWKNNIYIHDKIGKVIEIRNRDTVWVCKNKYNERGNLIEINKIKGEKFENVIFGYDSVDRLIKKSVESNKYPVNENTSFSVNNNSTIYEYDDKGKLISEITYNHKGQKSKAFFYKYNWKKL